MPLPHNEITPEHNPLFTEEDVLEAMREIPGYIDITPGDFQVIFAKAYEYARKKILHSARAGTFMRQPAICIFEEQPVAELIALLDKHQIAGVPVLDAGGKVVGVVSEKDILRSLGRNTQTKLMHLVADSLDTPFTLTEEERRRSLKQIMSSPPVTVTSDTLLEEIIAIFDTRSINRLPVVDAEGAPVGVITRHNIIKAFGKLL